MAGDGRTGISPLQAPFMVQVEPTERCNLNCQFCWRHLDPCDSRELSDERWLELADEICGLGASKVVISGGGEPLLRPELVLRMMERFSRSKIEGSLLTNGTLITEEIARRIVGHQWGAVQFSIHAPTAALHDAITGMKGSFDLALRGIRALNRQKRLKKSAFPKLAIRTVIFKSNLSTLPDVVHFAKSLGIEVIIVRLASVGKGGRTFPLSEDELKQFKTAVGHVRELADAVGIFLNLELLDVDSLVTAVKMLQDHPQPAAPVQTGGGPDGGEGRREDQHEGPHEDNVRETSCPSPFSELYLFANGTASPCPIFQLHSHDQKDTQTFQWLEDIALRPIKEVWQAGFATLRRTFSEGRPCQTCRDCSMNLKYRKGCWPESFFLQKFEHLKNSGQYTEGILFGFEQLKRYPNSPLLCRYTAEFHMALKEYRAAIGVLKRFEALGKKIGDMYLLLGRCYFEVADYDSSVRHFAANLAEVPSKRSQLISWYLLALCHKNMHQLDSMERCRSKLNELIGLFCNGNSLEERKLRAFVEEEIYRPTFEHLQRQKLYREGIYSGLEHLKACPDNALLHHYLGEFHMELGEYGTAIRYLSRAVGLDGKMEWTRFSLGKCYYCLGRYTEAEGALRENLEQTSNQESHFHSWYFKALSHEGLGQHKEMRTCLARAGRFSEQGLQFAAGWPTQFLHEGFQHLLGLHKFREGIGFGRRLLRVYPRNALLHHYLGEFHMEIGEYGTAIRYLSRAVGLDGKMEWTRFSLGKCYYCLGRYTEAEGALRENLEQTSNQECHFHSTLFLGMVADAKGDEAGCKEALRHLEEFKGFRGRELPLERELLLRLRAEGRLPAQIRNFLRGEPI